MQDTVAEECSRFADAVAMFVTVKLYDERITPLLREFQRRGGALSKLEARIKQECEAFTPAIESYVAAEQASFTQRLHLNLKAALGKTLPEQLRLGDELRQAADSSPYNASSQLTNAFGYEFTDGIGVVVSATAAMVGGVISGGFGHSLGVAIITTLLGTTGPVGFLIGALAGLVVAGAGWWLGRETVHEVVKQVELPGAVTNWVLWASGLDELLAAGRQRCYTAVKESINTRLQSLAPHIVERLRPSAKPQLWRRTSVL